MVGSVLREGTQFGDLGDYILVGNCCIMQNGRGHGDGTAQTCETSHGVGVEGEEG